GLPDRQMGNSEVGHVNLGAGRIVYQDLTRLDVEIKERTFFANKSIPQAASPLASWLSYLENLHSKSIDLGLERVSQVAARLDI
ncbi:hypothetical protein MJM04_35715, partial [Salmonella enterica subsp. enterica serovar Cerro]|nr:hypothetical protein [Salmonella enterica subsp. enterica serovar Cerro]